MYLMDQLVLVGASFSPGDTMYTFADYVYRHFNEVRDMGIEELAEACALSPATVSRLVGRLGFGSYREFREQCAQLAREYAHSRKGYDHFRLTPGNVEETLSRTLGPAAARVSDEQLDRFLGYLLPDHGVPYVIGLANMHTVAESIQFAVASYQAHTILAPANFRAIERAGEGDAVIVLTATGNVFRSTDVATLLRPCRARRLVVTTSNFDPVAAGVPADDVIRLWSPARQHLVNNYLMQLFVDMALCRAGLYD